MRLREELFKNQDLKYRDFHSHLLPTTPKEQIIGVRTPVIRKISKVAYKENWQNPCEYYEERIVKGLTIGMKKVSASEHIDDMASFVPLINNWAVCDLCSSSFKFVKKDLASYYDFIVSNNDGEEYHTRFAVVMLMGYYLTDEYIDDVLDLLKGIGSDYYYVNMAVAWALATAFVKYEDKVMDILSSRILSKDVQNKTIQKIKDSYRVPTDTKQMINMYKM